MPNEHACITLIANVAAADMSHLHAVLVICNAVINCLAGICGVVREPPLQCTPTITGRPCMLGHGLIPHVVSDQINSHI